MKKLRLIDKLLAFILHKNMFLSQIFIKKCFLWHGIKENNKIQLFSFHNFCQKHTSACLLPRIVRYVDSPKGRSTPFYSASFFPFWKALFNSKKLWWKKEREGMGQKPSQKSRDGVKAESEIQGKERAWAGRWIVLSLSFCVKVLYCINVYPCARINLFISQEGEFNDHQ